MTTPSVPENAPGWYGKLPTLGDFASRRLEADFIDAWDDWLAAGLAEWQGREPVGWLDAYLAGPSWRFLLMPDALGPGAAPLAGVLMPSVDRVGRYFPFTLAQPLARLPSQADELASLLDWLHRLNDVALDAMQDDWPVDQLETELARPECATPAWSEPAAAATPAWPGAGSLALREFQPVADLVAWLTQAGWARLLQDLPGQAWWWHTDAEGQPRLKVTQGLPRGTDFATLLGAAPSPAATIIATN